MTRTAVAEPKASKPQDHQDYVQVPRASLTDDISSRPFSELRAMAERGERGMKAVSLPSISRNLLGNGKCLYQIREQGEDGIETLRIVYLDDDVCLLRGGTDLLSGRKDKAFLHAQNW